MVTGLGFLPPVQARAKAVAVLAEAVGLPVPRPFAPTITRRQVILDGVPGAIYRPERPSPPILLVLGGVARIAVFGAYWDLVGVIQAVTTGVSIAGGERVPWEGPPLARDILVHHAVELAPASERAALRGALERRDPAALSLEARAIFDLLANEDPGRVEELAARLAPEARDVLTGFSPSSVGTRIDVPVVAMHSTDDPAVPYGEALRMMEALPRAQVITVRSFRHVDFQADAPGGWASTLADLWDAWRFASLVLDPGE